MPAKNSRSQINAEAEAWLVMREILATAQVMPTHGLCGMIGNLEQWRPCWRGDYVFSSNIANAMRNRVWQKIRASRKVYNTQKRRIPCHLYNGYLAPEFEVVSRIILCEEFALEAAKGRNMKTAVAAYILGSSGWNEYHCSEKIS